MSSFSKGLPVLFVAMLSACGGGNSGTTPTPALPPPPPPPVSVQITDAAAIRFLEQATFGPKPDDIAHLKSIGYDAWLTEQFAATPSNYPDATDATRLDFVQSIFFRNALTAPDQLRQRLAFALGQIFVVSDQKVDSRVGIVNFQRILLSDAFGGYSQLLKDVTLSPAMGTYLDMVNNTKADAALGSSPNENYAREIMQLFSIGVIKLQADGTPLLDANGKLVPTYTQDNIEGMARVFTGWTYPTKAGKVSQLFNDSYYVGMMESHEDFHETGTKQLLDALQPAGQGAPKDLDAGIDSIARHNNVGPFIGTRLIQSLVKSNPSPAYVQRVSAAFANNGQGIRGDMKAVVRAILLDPEARAGDAQAAVSTDGKLREPVLYMTRLLRAFNTRSDGIGIQNYSQLMRQDVFNAPSVFNFYPPSYKPQGYAIGGPEFKIVNAPTISARLNFLFDLTNRGLPTTTQPDFSDLIAVANDSNALINLLDTRLMHGTAPRSLKASVTQALSSVGNDANQRAMLALYLFAASPAFTIQR
ncbi:DUF1800 domain-containing protein [Undibacterium sp. Jales W-56]|uniref:DUF1800 domain-containing protein n=1 Tax=Undibacterium sp. Jales W-56 TaxID=2897325 RepID=UPI0021CF5282|nr:DUF1800 domain-containing protein [Undibacterium sp. Jales W-56]MCU6434102.1 DUF1800 domain-containing protein [Undibacterium sp. Jales W-56]